MPQIVRESKGYPNHGDTAFTVPLFDEFMKRIVPDDSWRNPERHSALPSVSPVVTSPSARG